MPLSEISSCVPTHIGISIHKIITAHMFVPSESMKRPFLFELGFCYCKSKELTMRALLILLLGLVGECRAVISACQWLATCQCVCVSASEKGDMIA